MTNITQFAAEIKFSPHGYPINPATGKMFTRAEIVSDPAIPLPTFVDPINPPPYWQRRTATELAAESKRITDKNRRNAQARDRRQTGRNGRRMVTMATIIAAPMLAMVERVNAADKFAAETNTQRTGAGGNTPDPDLTNGPRNLGESIMELNGQDYRAARQSSGTQIRKPSAEEAQRALDFALFPGKMNIAGPGRAQFGRRY